FRSSVAVWPIRGVVMLPVGMNVPEPCAATIDAWLNSSKNKSNSVNGNGFFTRVRTIRKNCLRIQSLSKKRLDSTSLIPPDQESLQLHKNGPSSFRKVPSTRIGTRS